MEDRGADVRADHQHEQDGAPLVQHEDAGRRVLVDAGEWRQADDADFGQEGVAAVFAIAEGQTGLAPAPTDDAQIVFKVTEVFEPAGADGSALPDQTKASFSSGLADDLLDQLVSRLEAEYDVRIDQGAVERAMAF